MREVAEVCLQPLFTTVGRGDTARICKEDRKIIDIGGPLPLQVTKSLLD